MVTVEEKESVAALATFTLSSSSAPVPAAPSAASAPVPAAAPVPAVSAAAVASPAPPSAAGSRVFASPLAKKLAREAGLDLPSVARQLGSGSGPKGRFIADDIVKAAGLYHLDSF